MNEDDDHVIGSKPGPVFSQAPSKVTTYDLSSTIVEIVGPEDPMSRVMPEQELPAIDVTEACYDEIRKKLVALGRGGTIIERGGPAGRVIICGDFVIRNRYVPRHR